MSDSSAAADLPLAGDQPPEEPRRSFFASAAAMVIGGIVGVVPMIAGLLFFLDPLIRRKAKGSVGGDEGFIKVKITKAELKKAGVPVKVPIIASKVDKWNRYPIQPIGSVYLQLAEDGETILAFNVTCPHLGCSVEFRKEETDYYCPCHTSAFALDGEKKNKIPPRGMDSLEVKEENDEIWVKYQEFRATLGEKVPV